MPRREPDTLPSVALLKRSDGTTWRSVIEPIIGKMADAPAHSTVDFDRWDRAVNVLLFEFERHPMPEFLIQLSPKLTTEFDQQSYASSMVGHRAERLVQAIELTAGALKSLEVGSLQLSAISARALLEVAVVSNDLHQQVVSPWRSVHGNISRVRKESRSASSTPHQLVYEARMGTRYYDSSAGWPQAKNITTRIQRVAKKSPPVQKVYDMLCDATHPNMEAHGVMWNSEHRNFGGFRAIRFAPGKSNSPVAGAVLDAVSISINLVIPFVRDLWWIAADITNSWDMGADERTRTLGLPGRTKRLDPCSCGSGAQTRTCRHPEPQFDPAREIGG